MMKMRSTMKRFAVGLFAAVAAMLAGCHNATGQMPPTAPVYTCPTPVFTTGVVGNYTVLNPVGSSTNPPVAAGTTSYTDTAPPVGTSCYTAQAYGGSPTPQVAAPSNVVSLTVASGQKVLLTWIPVCTSCVTIISRTAATLVPPPTAPSLGTPTTANLVRPALMPPTSEQVAGLSHRPVLTARLVR